MTYTKDEIIKEYLEAKNKKNQIRILADLNACPREDIEKILINEGVLKPRTRKTAPKTEKSGRKTTKSVNKSEKAEEKANGLPDVIVDALSEKLDKLDSEIIERRKQIIDLEEKIADEKAEIKNLESTYLLIANYILRVKDE